MPRLRSCRRLGPADPKVLGLVGAMGVNALRCLLTMHEFERIACASRRSETRAAFSREWSETLDIDADQAEMVDEAVHAADLGHDVDRYSGAGGMGEAGRDLRVPGAPRNESGRLEAFRQGRFLTTGKRT